MHDLAVFDQRELRGATADVHMQQRVIKLVRQRRRSRTVRRQDPLQVVPGRGAHELPTLASEQLGHGSRVGPFERRPGQDYRTSVDLFGG